MLSPLEQLYLETTSKEDLLAEIKDQQRIANEAKAKWSKVDGLLRQLTKEHQPLMIENAKLKLSLNATRNQLHRLRKKYGENKDSVTSQIIGLIEQGLSNDEITEMGFNRSTVRAQRSRINAIKGVS